MTVTNPDSNCATPESPDADNLNSATHLVPPLPATIGSRPEVSAGSPAKPANPAPPQWAIERFFNWLGRYPAAVGKALDRLAARPGPVGRIVSFFSSVRLGLVWLFLTATYIAIGSGMPWVRSAFDVTSMEFFDAPPMVILMLLLITTLTVVTLRRITLSLYKLGVWTVHTGIITLVIGCFFYFGMKHEGMVRIFLNQKVNHYYDSSIRALYIVNPNNQRHVMVGLPQLPIFKKRSPGDNPLDIPIPANDLIQLNRAWNNAQVAIVGYYPYSEIAPTPFNRPVNHAPHNPAIAVNLSAGGVSSGAQWLLGKLPAGRVMDRGSPFGIEYLYHPTARRQRDITTSFHGTNAMIVNVPKDHVRRVYIIKPNMPIVVKGTPYTLTPIAKITMPLRSPGYLGATSQCYMINVTRKDAGGPFKFQRVALFRYPTRSVDFILKQGQRELIPDKIDHQLHIRYLDATRDQFWVVEHKNGTFTLVHRATGGRVTVRPMKLGSNSPAVVQGMPVKFSLESAADMRFRPELIPPTDRRPKVENTMGKCVLELRISRPGHRPQPVYLQYQQFGLSGDLPPAKVRMGNGQTADFIFSQLERPLPVALKLMACKELFYSGGENFPRDFISKVRMTNDKTGQTRIAVIHLNHPAQAAGLHLFQARFGHDPATGHPFTVLGVGNTHGFYAMLVGVVMVILGIGYAFYVKPILLNIKKKQLAAYAAGLQKSSTHKNASV